MPGGDVSSFVNLSGAGVLSDDLAAIDLLSFLLTDDAQRYFAETTYEYPLVPGVPVALDLPPLAEMVVADVDYAELSAALDRALVLINASGLSRF